MGKDFADEFADRLKPLYGKLISEVSCIHGEKDVFAVQWGKDFPEEPHKGILFVGKATNEWVAESDVDTMFGDPHSKSTLFNRHNQMSWVYDAMGSNQDYNINRSAFWRVVRKVADHFYGEGGLNHVAWSNVCKIQHHSGKNPSGNFFTKQIPICQEIFRAEIECLSPKVVVFFTSGYGDEQLLTYLNDGNMPTILNDVSWADYSIWVYKIKETSSSKETYFISSCHPQGKPEKEHVDCLVKIISDIIDAGEQECAAALQDNRQLSEKHRQAMDP